MTQPDKDARQSTTRGEGAVEVPPGLPGAKSARVPPWPGNVPSQAHALEVLRGVKPPPEALPTARRMQEGLTRPEREALGTEGTAEEALREALCLRWRMAAAFDLFPADQTTIDHPAFDALLAEVDDVLGRLQAVEGSTPELGLALDRSSEALTREVLELSRRVRVAESAPAAAPAAQRSAAPTGKVTFTPEEGKTAPRRRLKPLYLAFGAVALVAALYHGRSLLAPKPSEPSVPGAPPHTLVVPDPTSGAMMVSTTSGGPPNDEQRAWLEKQQANGLQIKEIGPGSFLLVPASASPATAEPSTP